MSEFCWRSLRPRAAVCASKRSCGVATRRLRPPPSLETLIAFKDRSNAPQATYKSRDGFGGGPSVRTGSPLTGCPNGYVPLTS